MPFLQIAFLVAAGLTGRAIAVNNGLARTPQMGWNNWNTFGCAVSETLLLETAQKLVDSGLRDLGYKYVILDDCWSDGRDEDNMLRADEHKFPRGMGYVADQIHDLGMLFGMYSSAGEMTCARYAGSLDYETYDAKAFAAWKVDYLKYDNCFHLGRFGTPKISFDRYNVMWKALNATGRPILYSLCNWGEDYPHTWGMSIANSWRISGDIYDSFSRPDDLCSCNSPSDPHCVAPGTHCSVINIINKVTPYVDRGAPGGWNDLDMLEVGNGGMTDDEYVAHFTMWAALKSPLLLGNDIRELTGKSLTILNNPAIIAISQDPLGRSAFRIRRDTTDIPKDKYGVGEIQIWSGHLWGGDQIVIFLNAGGKEMEVSATLEEIFVGDGPEGSAPQVHQTWDVYDLWANRMEESLGEQLLKAGLETYEKILNDANWYNSTALPYKDGLAAGDERLMGKKIGVVKADGTWKATVRAHAARVFRLRNSDNHKFARYSTQKDEL